MMGCLAGQDREPRSTVFGAVSQSGCYAAMLTKLPVHSRGKKEKTQPSTCEKDDKDLPNLSAVCSQSFINNTSCKLATAKVHLQFDENKTWYLMTSVES